MHAQELMWDVSDSTSPLPVVDTTHKTVVAVLNRCVGAALSHTIQERPFILFYIRGRNFRYTEKRLANGRIYFGAQDRGLARNWEFG